MKKVDLNHLTDKTLINHSELFKLFKDYLQDVLKYDECEAEFVVATDLKNPYDTPYIMQDYEGVFG